MSETARMWMEVTFNVVYLIVVWGLVIVMAHHESAVAPGDRRVARLIRWAFTFLALGDTGHVGFRVLAFAQGDLQATVSIFGREFGLVGLGALSTAITVTVFYVLMLEVWRIRFDKKYGPFEYLLLAAAVLRLLIMIPAANQWNNTVPPQPWSLYRNLPLTILGLGIACPHPARRPPRRRPALYLDRHQHPGLLRHVHPRHSLCPAGAYHRHAHDPQDLGLRRHRLHRLFQPLPPAGGRRGSRPGRLATTA